MSCEKCPGASVSELKKKKTREMIYNMSEITLSKYK